MKKKLVAALVFAMTLSMFTACGQTTETTDSTATETTEETTEETTDTTEESTDEIETTEVALETYEGDGWSLQYDPNSIAVNESDDGSVVFSYYNENITTAGTNYMMVTKYEDTDYETVLTQKQEENNATDVEISESGFGSLDATAYDVTKNYEASEDSGLQVVMTWTAIPVDSDVILLEFYSTVETEDEPGMAVSAAFETVAQTFVLTTDDSAAN